MHTLPRPTTTQAYHKRKSHQRSEAVQLVHTRVEHLLGDLCRRPPPPPPPDSQHSADCAESNTSTADPQSSTGPRRSAAPQQSQIAGMSDEQLFAGELDPAAGKLGADRALRKRQQLRSVASHVLPLLEPGSRVVEFGAGCGHLSLLLASLRPDCLFTLVEVKPYTSNIAAERVASSGLANAAVFTGSIDEYASSAACFDVAIGSPPPRPAQRHSQASSRPEEWPMNRPPPLRPANRRVPRPRDAAARARLRRALLLRPAGGRRGPRARRWSGARPAASLARLPCIARRGGRGCLPGSHQGCRLRGGGEGRSLRCRRSRLPHGAALHEARRRGPTARGMRGVAVRRLARHTPGLASCGTR